MAQHKKLTLFFVCMSFLLSLSSMAQSTVGKEFIVGFMENNRKPTQADKAVIVITAQENATGSISYQGQSISFSLTKGQSMEQEFLSTSQDVMHRDSEVVGSQSISISSSGNISVYAYNSRQNSSDGTLVLPLTLLGSEYFLTAHFSPLANGPDNSESTALIIATEDNTQVEITPSFATLNGKAAKVPFTITLNQGQSYQIKALGDLTGTHVRVLNPLEGNCKKLAVFGGNKMTSVGACGKTGDHLFQQAIPVEFWGKSYIHVPLRNRTSGEVLKILAAQNGTQVSVNGENKGELNAGEFMTLEFGVNDLGVIETSQPASVSLLAKSQDCNTLANNIGDPFLLTYQSNEQRIKELQFYSVNEFYNNANIIAPSASVSQIRLNGTAITTQFKPVPGKPEFSYAQVNVKDFDNTFSSPEGAIIYVYGSGQRSSYGYSAGFNLSGGGSATEEPVYEFEKEGKEIVCLGLEEAWEILPKDDRFKFFKWNFGDDTPLKDGRNISHTYSQSGVFQVTVLASSGSGPCDISAEYEFEIEVIPEVTATVSGPENACANVEVTYLLESELSFIKGEWIEVLGGEKISETENLITVKWNEITTEGLIRVVPISESGCLGKEIVFKVGIGEGELLEAPIGLASICGTLEAPIVYRASTTAASSTFEWTIKGGQIISGANTSEVKVTWDANAASRELSYQISPGESNTCSTTSEVLKVESIEPLRVVSAEQKLPSCPGESDGGVVLEVSGGSGSYTFAWSHDKALSASTATNLKAGTYWVTISDQSGCGILTYELVLNDPPAMRLTRELQVVASSCEGVSDGGFKARISGGVPPYTVEGINSTWNGEELEVKNLASGPFSLFVLDSKGCSLPISGTIPGNKPMILSFTEVSPGCPGGGNGALTVNISGGQPPYAIQWSEDQGGIGIMAASNKFFNYSGQTLSAVSSGFYTVSVTDASGCVVTALGRVRETAPQVRMPTGFMPKDGWYGPVSNCTPSFMLQVWDRWGQVIYLGSEGWDGMVKGKEAPIGNYTYQLTYSYTIEGVTEQVTSRGVFTLIR